MARSLAVASVMVAPVGALDGVASGFGWGPLVACVVLGVGGTGFAFVFAASLAGRVGPVRTSIVT